MYIVVESIAEDGFKEILAVPTTFIVNGSYYYPHKYSKISPEIAIKKHITPNLKDGNWKVVGEFRIISKEFASLKEAKAEEKRKFNFFDTASEQEYMAKKQYKRMHPVNYNADSFEDFNKLLQDNEKFSLSQINSSLEVFNTQINKINGNSPVRNVFLRKSPLSSPIAMIRPRIQSSPSSPPPSSPPPSSPPPSSPPPSFAPPLTSIETTSKQPSSTQTYTSTSLSFNKQKKSIYQMHTN